MKRLNSSKYSESWILDLEWKTDNLIQEVRSDMWVIDPREWDPRGVWIDENYVAWDEADSLAGEWELML